MLILFAHVLLSVPLQKFLHFPVVVFAFEITPPLFPPRLLTQLILGNASAERVAEYGGGPSFCYIEYIQ